MAEKQITIITGTIIAEKSFLTLSELSQACHVNEEVIIEMVEEGLLEPEGKSVAKWQFNSSQLRRARSALRLQHDLNINFAGLAVILDLIEELQSLRRQMHILSIH